jgi:hypothetical protein
MNVYLELFKDKPLIMSDVELDLERSPRPNLMAYLESPYIYIWLYIYIFSSVPQL